MNTATTGNKLAQMPRNDGFRVNHSSAVHLGRSKLGGQSTDFHLKHT